MTLLDHRPSELADQQAEALFKEARRRRHRRWFVAGVISLAGLVAALVAVQLAGSHPTSGPFQSARLQPTPSTVSEPSCQPVELAASTPPYGDAGGTFSQTVTLTNTASKTCQLQGWPQFRVADASGRFLTGPTQRVRQNTPPAHPWSTVVLAPGQSSSFNVYGQLYDALHDRVCPTTASASVSLPGGTSPLVVPLQIPNCGTFEIAPLVKGDSDRVSWSTEVLPYVKTPPAVKKSH
jgi:hypothetical protein